MTPIVQNVIRFEPTATSWDIDFGLLASETGKVPKVKSVKVKDLDANEAVNYDKSALTVGVVRDSSRTEINRFALLYRKALDWALDDSESTEYATLKDKILSNVDKAAHPSRVAIDPSKLPFKVEDQGTYPISIEIEDGANTLTVNTTVL